MISRLSALAFIALVVHTPIAARSDCFRPYRVEIANQSGGLAVIQKSNGLAGIARKAEIPNNQAVTVMVKRRGASVDILAGSEGTKSSRAVTFYGKEPNSFPAQVALLPKEVSTKGFHTQNASYTVKLTNQSGGILSIVGGCVTVPDTHRTMAEDSSVMLSVQPGDFIIIQSGVENKKVKHRLLFSEQHGANPVVTVTKRGFTTRGINHKDVDVQTQRFFGNKGLYKVRTQVTKKFLSKRKAQQDQQATPTTTPAKPSRSFFSRRAKQ
jgi:hypothetical protein